MGTSEVSYMAAGHKPCHLTRDMREGPMSTKSQDWSALASHNERVAPAGSAAAPPTGTGTDLDSLPAKRTAQVKSRLRLRKRAGRPGTAARA
jgi:hypothetical protein